MSSIAGVSGARTVGSGATKSNTSLALDPNEFLSLFVAELKNQDPTKPMDTGQLVQQMSSMSQVEQAVQTNTKLASLLEQMTIGQAAGMVGRNIESADGTVAGVVQSVQVTTTGLVAGLADGRSLTIEPGVTIRA